MTMQTQQTEGESEDEQPNLTKQPLDEEEQVRMYELQAFMHQSPCISARIGVPYWMCTHLFAEFVLNLFQAAVKPAQTESDVDLDIESKSQNACAVSQPTFPSPLIHGA